VTAIEKFQSAKKGALSARIDLQHFFALNPCKNRVQIPKFGANRTSGSRDIANPIFCLIDWGLWVD
jgi:hypothetical protein